MNNQQYAFSHFFKNLSVELKDKKISLGEIMLRLGDRSHAFVILLAALPFLIPITIPGFSTPFGVLIIIISVCLMLNLPPKIPSRISNFSFGGGKAAEVFGRSAKILSKIEKLSKPRGEFAFGSSLATFIIGAIILFAGILLALPTPPGGNFPPAVALVFLSIGVLQRDLLFFLIGTVATISTTILFYAIIRAFTIGGEALLS